ncbi:RadC-like JAB domain-containing protein [Dyadobacter soli]|uniref:RadC-like JAB domain-containing protein n=1 Tax=Dyadobacter soli TaxID=659014 RepID=A0A1G7MLF1_9BACT|nr:JAB domain-containing protein [Dyadobacter soli]SDF61910.1 RadC-like JAB domain-containing protein [Dyadobacter soli]
METTQKFSDCFQVAEIELIYTPSYKVTDRPKVTSPASSYGILRSSWNAGKLGFIEEFKVLLLNRGNLVLGIYNVCRGGITSTTADIRLIFAAALKASATGIILAHNHPSGTLLPSPQDRLLTLRIKEVSQLMEIELLDHLILTAEGFYSFAEQGQL